MGGQSSRWLSTPLPLSSGKHEFGGTQKSRAKEKQADYRTCRPKEALICFSARLLALFWRAFKLGQPFRGVHSMVSDFVRS